MLNMETHTQIEEASSRRRSVKSEKLYLEDYIEFLHSHQTLRLTVDHLNQKILTDAVDTLDLMDLPRSILNESVSSLANLTRGSSR